MACRPKRSPPIISGAQPRTARDLRRVKRCGIDACSPALVDVRGHPCLWSALASRQAIPARGSWLRGRRSAPTALRFSARGRVAELAAFALLTALKQLRRVSLRCALRAPTPGLRSSSLHKSPPAGTACRDDSSRASFLTQGTAVSAKACPDRPWRACGAPSSTGLAAARVCALRRLTRRHCLSAANEVSEASSAAGCNTEQHREVGAQRRPRRRSAVDCPGTPLPYKPSLTCPAGPRASKLWCAPATPRVCSVRQARDSASGRIFAVEVDTLSSAQDRCGPGAAACCEDARRAMFQVNSEDDR